MLCEQRVYPRACGGTRLGPRTRKMPVGLSPRMRGNPIIGGCSVDVRRSIPAHAGEPELEQQACVKVQVYPRACGGTPNVQPHRAKSGGLSPRMRGNQIDIRGHGGPHGSIPAHAGEPPESV